jgi:hypothetical protein
MLLHQSAYRGLILPFGLRNADFILSRDTVIIDGIRVGNWIY